ncbi:sensor histidine kinase/response regulator hybrid protein [Rhizobium etli 8C-3]|uniref:histidine kinase n=2 Tax=Rhizobium TaxID=379 RepID=A0A4R3QTG1_9HYPH|nr:MULTISPECIES: histidine kinase dimerization/phosphoacceptor domain -containing protein [Rhizobium]APO75266.1 sensor histidine kinase/response regulator hybrid protein [Rhizobium etli 8C-3]TCU25640.1 two-component sensor histidine kinase [Rhizobium azibense]TCU40073.1 two-component sensor histidine kinase [Rhizobium azibense]
MRESADDADLEIRVLYIDDDETLALRLKENLARHGFAVEWAQDGAAGLKRIAKGGIDAVVIDHLLQNETGLDVLPQVMALPDHPPVIYATASEDTGIAVAALKAGADDYVLKGNSRDYFDLLAATLEQGLERARFRRETAEAQEVIRQQRDRAEMLLAEVNHRIANSLGLVGALIRMQSSLTTDQVAIDALHETQMRINAIASVHRRLYNSRQIGTVQLDEYVENLLRELETSIRDDKRPHRIVLTARQMDLPTDKVVTLGLIVSELVTNAFKYAYDEGVEGEIRVIVEQAGEQLRLVVEDDGAGFDHSSPAKGTGLGTKILTAMAASLKSELTYDPDHRGTRAILIFSTD